jgi:glycosyltransferase involved in cell wall biosynthesis
MPVLIFSDHPERVSGLARLARDLAGRIWNDREELGLFPAQLGLAVKPPLLPYPVPYPVYYTCDWEDFGAQDLPKVWEHFLNYCWARRGILWATWDSSMCFPSLATRLPGCTRWGYFPIDSESVNGGIDGPAGEVIKAYPSVAAYSKFGAVVLGRTRDEEVSNLYPGIDGKVFSPEAIGSREAQWLAQAWKLRSGDIIVGCVAANRKRKDFGLLFHAWRLLADQFPTLRCWLHTDYEISDDWSVPQLVEMFGLEDRFILSTSLNDRYLAAGYSLCACTIAPGLGEGFGYPIVESLACGTPVVHGNFAAGAELIPCEEWLFEPLAYRLESVYALPRPVYSALDVSTRVGAIIEQLKKDKELRNFCRAAGENYSWERVWPMWKEWILREKGRIK